jgi:hypothetical protein
VFEEVFLYVSIEEAQRLISQGKKAQIKLVFVGLNPDNTTGWSDKFWSLEIASADEAVISWGSNMRKPTSQRKPVKVAFATARKKLKKGYVYYAESI